MNYRHGLLLLLAVLFAGCGIKDPFGDDRTSQKLGNLPPQTHLFLHVTPFFVNEHLPDHLHDSGQITLLICYGIEHSRVSNDID